MFFESDDFLMALRDYQVKAVDSVIEGYRQGKKKFLISMATGTGKSMVCMAVARYFLERHIIDKVIFIYDRVDLSKQMLSRLIQFFPEGTISEFPFNIGSSQIIVTTSQKFFKNGNYTTDLPNTLNVLVIYDDIIKGLPRRINDLLGYFNCYVLGVTSITKKIDEISINNFFETSEPLFKYSLIDALSEGYLTESDPNAYKRKHEDSFDGIMSDFISLLDIYPQSSHFIYAFKNILMKLRKEFYLLEDTRDLFNAYLDSNLSKEDIRSLGYKKEQLDIFGRLLNDEAYFTEKKKEFHNTEAVWEDFFEHNKWIFGHSLNCIFTTSLDNKKLEQVISGYSFNKYGKRVDALMKTRGLISSLCFVEIKNHKTKLLSNQYRRGCWSISEEVAGGISQIQKYVQLSFKKIESKIEITSSEGDPTGEIIYNFNPRSYLIVGSLGEFMTSNGINEDKLSSFEVFRSNITSPEIITFDELYERAILSLENFKYD
ncbi:Shedu anti-phage system protein SduA domain-containing protein [Paenibacillus maysiensis]|uniref:Shedu anti-phage system protein SduA domain-containing protein n=1 Tax=Paenibacillus maysiensis TaxID=1155954 RepID=UPI0004719A80|nr:Shedu anti-phage system protein SduA domain-containing protein [Paenibacillus maysiensis]